MSPGIIRVEHVYRHPPSAVWRALTDPALHARWFVPGDVRPVVGHRFSLDMGKWGKQPCEVLEVQAQRLLKYRFASGTFDTTITWELSPAEGGTRLTLIHEGFDLDSPMARQAFEGMRPGWPSVLERLGEVLSSASEASANF
jgi:uncharacterized protein YndB with AHSA1/START domain